MFKKINLILFIIFVSSCSTKKNIVYLNNSISNQNFEYDYKSYKLKVDDVLKIDVNTGELFETSTTNIISKNITGASNYPTRESLIYNGYQIDHNGYFEYPSLGKIYAKGLNLEELRDLLKSSFIDAKIYLDPVIDIKLLNRKVNVLGDVARPGVYYFDKNNLNIFEALGLAGDLSITGDRKNVKIIRFIDNQTKIFELDLTDINTLNSKYYQIFSGDTIIVNPNTTRVKNAGIIGNSGTLISLLSFVISSLILITNN